MSFSISSKLAPKNGGHADIIDIAGKSSEPEVAHPAGLFFSLLTGLVVRAIRLRWPGHEIQEIHAGFIFVVKNIEKCLANSYEKGEVSETVASKTLDDPAWTSGAPTQVDRAASSSKS